MLDATPDAVVVKDEDLRWVLVNDALCRMLGRPRERLLGTTDHDHSPPAEGERRLLEHAAAVFPRGFTVADAEGRVVLANEAFGRALGLGEGGAGLAGRPVDALVAGALPASELTTRREAYALGDGQAVQLAIPGEAWLVLRARRSDDGRTVLSLVDVTGFRRNEAALTRLALEDHLTGLANRRHLAEAGRSAVLHARRHARPLSLLLLDIDHFKRVNDGFGHDADDAALRRFGALCRAGFRAGDTVGRIGGEEFAALLPDTDLAGAVTLAERLRAHVAAEVVCHGHSRIAFSVSVGAAELAPAARDFDAFLKAADGALCAAKRAGRDRTCAAPPRPRSARPLPRAEAVAPRGCWSGPPRPRGRAPDPAAPGPQSSRPRGRSATDAP